jgi:signal transduction histidine kinase
LPASGGTLIKFRDEGEGIPPHELAHLFERYYRAPAQSKGRRGLGLGLYIAHALVEMHGGTLSATSTLGAGSTFELWLPGPPEPAD